WFVCIIMLAGAGAALGRTAVVAPMTGLVLRGHVRLTERGLVVVNAERDLWQELALTNLAWASFDRPAPAFLPDPSAEAAQPWMEHAIGPTAQGQAFRIRSSGLGLRASADSFYFVCQSARGDIEIVAQVASAQQAHPAARVGLMMREHLGPDSRYVMAGLTPRRAAVLEWRDQESAPSQSMAQGQMTVPGWIKLKREGDSFQAYQSRNGLQWASAGKIAFPMNGSCYVGLATASGLQWTLHGTTFDKVEVGVDLCNRLFPPRAELVSGSVIVGRPVLAESGLVDFRWGVEEVSLPLRSIARLIYQWVSPEWLGRAPQGQSGVWLANGEFLEGDLRSLHGGRLRLSSVLHGARTLDANSEVLMVGLQGTSPIPAPFEVTTLSGSVWRGQSLAFGDNEVILQEPVLGKVTIPIHYLASILRR
ncbi:MAG: hypothetical protein NTW03_04240, partial [Verrucomicrobia bacterium]|nr:hypothetical protein [Verrucomicrobiota bacterium]